jgi:hypothetical protein
VDGLSKLTNLQELAITNEHLDDEVLATIARFCTELKLLFVVEGEITGQGLKAVVKNLLSLQTFCLICHFDYVQHLPSIKTSRPRGAEIVSVLINRDNSYCTAYRPDDPEDNVNANANYNETLRKTSVGDMALTYCPEPVVCYELVDFKQLLSDRDYLAELARKYWIMRILADVAP